MVYGLSPFFARARDPELAPLGLKQRGPPRAARKYGLRPDLILVCPVQFNGRASLLRLFSKSTCEVHKFTEEPSILQQAAK
jgi:hypothetical protein